MRKKIGIITIIDNQNYGNRLQNFALSDFIRKSTEADVFTIRNRGFVDYSYVKGYDKGKIENCLKQTWVGDRLIGKVRKKRDRKDTLFDLKEERVRRFGEFNAKYINFTSFELSSFKLKDRRLKKFDLFITGSDQVWNPQFQRATQIDFLQFAPSGKRISYAASIGIMSIPESRQRLFGNFVSGIKHIALRQETAGDMIERFFRRKATVVLDPTLLLTSNDWRKIAKKPDIKLPEHYALVYFLGEISDGQRELFLKYVHAKNWEILYLNDVEQWNLYTISPDEFVYLFYRAEAVFTDSYHGTIFSILFHRDFWVFRRDKFEIYARIRDLLDKLGLNDREVTQQGQELLSIGEEQYTKAVNILEAERIRSKDWLLGILESYV